MRAITQSMGCRKNCKCEQYVDTVSAPITFLYQHRPFKVFTYSEHGTNVEKFPRFCAAPICIIYKQESFFCIDFNIATPKLAAILEQTLHF